jgi:chemotaxis protein MotB
MAIEPDEPIEIPEWVVTFGDMMSLLLTFFIMLVSMSEIKDESRFQAMVESMVQRFGRDDTFVSPVPGPAKPKTARLAKIASDSSESRNGLAKGGDPARAAVGENPLVQSIREGDDLARGGVLYFKRGETELDKTHPRRLMVVIEEIARRPHKIQVRGHTSQAAPPADSPFKTNWEVAFERCRQVRDFMLQHGIADSRRIEISVAGQHEPVHASIDSLLTSNNDRVEIVMIDELAVDPDD